MKKIISAVLSAAISLGGFAAMADDARVEIQFKVGDSVLSINGSEVEVVTPYVKGKGTTLVPLRVITEAFGAKVEWVDETQTVNLEYPDVNISLQIDNEVVTVNDHKETLDVAPELIEGTTMVPLRFISESFGADVRFDDETKAITVVKETQESGETIVGVTELTYSGNSYYKYSMETPKRLSSVNYSSNRRDVAYTDGGDTEFDIYITERSNYDEDYTTAKVLESMKNYAKDAVLMAAEASRDAQNNEFAHVKLKSNGKIIEFKTIFTDKYVYHISAYVSADDKDMQNYISGIFNSFKASYLGGNDIYDFSNIDGNGMYSYKNDEYRFSLNMPEYLSIDNEDTNAMEFSSEAKKYSENRVFVGVYSKTETVTAESMLKRDKEHNTAMYNPELMTVNDIQNGYINNIPCAGYDMIIDGSGQYSGQLRDMFVELGDYVYNISIFLDKSSVHYMDKIMQSIVLEELDGEHIGSLLRNNRDTSNPLKLDNSYYSLELPGSWRSLSSGDIVGVIDSNTGTTMAITAKSPASGSIVQNMNAFTAFLNEKGYNIEKEYNNETFNGITMRKSIYSTDTKTGKMYMIMYMLRKGNTEIEISIMQPEEMYNGSATQEAENMIRTSLQFK